MHEQTNDTVTRPWQRIILGIPHSLSIKTLSKNRRDHSDFLGFQGTAVQSAVCSQMTHYESSLLTNTTYGDAQSSE